MPAFHPSLRDLPDEIPIFPLPGALLLPQGSLPLNIFEPRYLAMVEDALGAGRMFGMVQPDPSQPRGEAGPGVFRVGCLGRVTSFSETEDGRMLISLLGVTRFRVEAEVAPRRGYRRVRATYAPFAGDLSVDGPAPHLDREGLVGALRPYFRARGIEANWDAIESTPDAMLVTTLCMVCPFDTREKQALLEADTVPARAAMLVALMQMDMHGGPAEGLPS